MAFPARAAVFRDENLQVHGGKWADAPKPLKPSARSVLQERKPLQDRKPLQERKPLQDVSNVPKGTALKERSTLKVKERSALCSHEAIKKPNKTEILADKETKKCHEWANDGVEGAQFTGNDSQKSDKDALDKRVKKKVENVMSALHCWSDVVFDPVLYPAKDAAKFFEEVNGLELEPEILPDTTSSRLSNSGHKAKLAEDPFADDELDQYPFLDDKPVEFVLRDELVNPALGVN